MAKQTDVDNLNRTVSKAWADSLDTVKVYFPLDVKLRDHDDLEHYDDIDYWRDDVTAAEAVGYTGEILAQLAKENSRLERPHGLMEYFDRDNPMFQKVYSMFPAVEEHDGELWGVMEMKVDGTLSLAEIDSLKDYVCGQNADGESLEQHEIKVDRGELYVSLWSPEKSYKIHTQEEFTAIMPETNQSQGIGGIS